MMRRDQIRAHKRPTPTLVDLCVQKVIHNVRYLGNVGSFDQHLLEQILPHCTADQLMHVEKSTKGRDLSPVTDKLWKKFFEKQFGTNSTDEVIKRMKEKRVSFRWMQLFETKGKEMAQAENEALDRIRQLYKKEDANNGPRYNVSNVKSNIMKKAKIEFLKRFVFVLKDKSRRASGIQFWPWPIGGVFLMNDEDDGITRIMLSADDSDGLCMGPKTTWGLGVVVKSLRPLATKVVESEEML
ncbi:hypothetical protein JHK82_049880 [Glycine max]|nr:hypothetical protein JHK85_050506 [Glycine max]KAG5091102.1 hypothetical protein JHK82_049880 [Glycine max]KAG5094202.1 hypothetical protein JHK84_049790 [Glycine max]